MSDQSATKIDPFEPQNQRQAELLDEVAAANQQSAPSVAAPTATQPETSVEAEADKPAQQMSSQIKPEPVTVAEQAPIEPSVAGESTQLPVENSVAQKISQAIKEGNLAALEKEIYPS